MRSIDKIKLSVTATIRDALIIIDRGAMQIAIVISDDDKLVGTVSDGDIRRGLLNGLTLDDKVESVMFEHPLFAVVSEPRQAILEEAIAKSIRQVPVVDVTGKVLGVEKIDALVRPKIKDNKVILMAGGLGTRLRPLTEGTPKPMLEIGGKPILLTIVQQFVEQGFINFVMCVNYKSQIIKDFFGDGERFGANIEYVVEEERMGTGGALSLLPEVPKEPFFVMNGDLLTNVTFEYLLEYHEQARAMATMCVKEYDFQVPYGVLELNNNEIVSIEEKPVHRFFVSAGIYMISPDMLKLVPKGVFYDMPKLFEDAIEKGEKVVSFPIREYWIDIGRHEELEQAGKEYERYFNV